MYLTKFLYEKFISTDLFTTESVIRYRNSIIKNNEKVLVKVLKEEVCEVTIKKTFDDKQFLQIVFTQIPVTDAQWQFDILFNFLIYGFR